MAFFRRPFVVRRPVPRTATNQKRLNLQRLEDRAVPTVLVTQNFDGVAAGTLPTGWTATILTGTTAGWNTVSTNAASTPNSAFSPDIASVSDAVLVSPSFTPASAATLTFSNAFNLEQSSSTTAFDVSVLEISIANVNGGAFQDFVAAGGTFTTGGYNHTTTSTAFNNPLGGRPGWSGQSTGFTSNQFVAVSANLPAAAVGQVTQLRWRVATDSSVAPTGTPAAGMYIDNVVIQDAGVPATANLAITKTNGVSGVTAGGTTTYTIVVTNAGPDAVTNALVNDVLPAAITSATWTAVAAGGATVGTANGNGNINNVSVSLPASGGSVTFTITANISSSATGNLVNTATVGAPVGTTDPNTANNTATDTDPISPPTANLGITSITNNVSSVYANGPTSYTVVVNNSGPGSANGALLTVASTPAGALVYSGWSATYTGGATGPASGTGAVTGVAINLPTGGEATFTVNGVLSSTATGTLVTTATIIAPAGITDPTPGNNTLSDSDPINPPTADLSVSVADNGVNGVIAGFPTTYTITVNNAGPSNVVGAQVSNVFAPGTNVSSANWTRTGTTGGATAPPSGSGSLTNVLVDLPANSSVTFSLVATVSASATGTLTNTVTITPPSGTTDPAPANGIKVDTDPILPGGDLSVTLSNNTTAPVPGATVTYTLVVANAGPNTATGATVITNLPATLQNVTWTVAGTTGGATPGNNSGTGNLNELVNLPAASSITYTITATIDPAATGPLNATATINPPTGFADPTPGNNTANDNDTLVPTGDVSITVDDGLSSVTAGTATSYTVVVSNSGPSTATGVDVSVPFGGLTGVTWTATVTGGAIANTSGNGDIAETVTLPSGATVTYIVTGSLPAPAAGVLTITATADVATGFTDPDLTNNTATDTTDIIEIGGTLYAIGADAGGGPHVKVYFAATGDLKFSFFAFAPNFTGGVRVAVGDVTGDGQDDIVVAAGAGGGPHVKVYDGFFGGLVREFFAYDASFTGGVNLAIADVNNDGVGDIVTGPGTGGGPHVRVFSGIDGSIIREFYAFEPTAIGSSLLVDTTFATGANVAAGDMNGDGFAEIIVGAGRGRAPIVRVFDGDTGALTAEFQAFPTAFLGGVYVAAGDVNGDGKADVITGAGAGATPLVRIFDGDTLDLISSYFAYAENFTGGVHVAARDLDGDGLAEVLTGAGKGGGPHVAAFHPLLADNFAGFYGFDPSFTGGVFVG